MRPVRLFLIFMVLSAGRLFAQNSTTATVFRPSITSTTPQSLTTGAGPTLLTIRGNLFQRGAAVFFNGRKVDITRSEGDSLLVVVIPDELTANPDIATLLVENPDQTKIGYRISIQKRPPPRISWYLPRICPATVNTLTIGGANFYHGAIVQVGDFVLPIMSLDSTRIIAIVPESVLSKFYWSRIVVTNFDGQQASQQLIPLPESGGPLSINLVTPSRFELGSARILVIEGVNFDDPLCGLNLSVRLGQTTLSIVSVAPNRIIVRVPSNLQAGTYQLSVIRFDGGTDSASISIEPTSVGTMSGQEANEITTTLFPNPATTALTLETTLDRASTLVLSVRNILGERVLEERHDAASGRFTATLDVSGLASGVYLLEVSNGAARWSQKFVKY